MSLVLTQPPHPPLSKPSGNPPRTLTHVALKRTERAQVVALPVALPARETRRLAGMSIPGAPIETPVPCRNGLKLWVSDVAKVSKDHRVLGRCWVQVRPPGPADAAISTATASTFTLRHPRRPGPAARRGDPRRPRRGDGARAGPRRKRLPISIARTRAHARIGYPPPSRSSSRWGLVAGAFARQGNATADRLQAQGSAPTGSTRQRSRVTLKTSGWIWPGAMSLGWSTGLYPRTDPYAPRRDVVAMVDKAVDEAFSPAAMTTPEGSMKLLLTSGGVTNTSIRDALVDLLGKPIADSSALCIPTAQWGHPMCGPASVRGFVGGVLPWGGMSSMEWKSLGVLS